MKSILPQNIKFKKYTLADRQQVITLNRPTTQNLALGWWLFSLLSAFFILYLLVVHPTLARAASPPSSYTQYTEAKNYYQNLLSDQKKADSRRSWLTGIKNFRRIYHAQPDHEIAPSCLFMMARMYSDMYKQFDNPLDLGEAIAYYEDITSLFPKHRLADDALYAIGRIYLEDKNNPQKAAKIFTRIVALFPNGDMAIPAAGQIEKLKRNSGEKTSDDDTFTILEAGPIKQKIGADKPADSIATSNETANLLPLRYWSTNNYTRVVIETSSPVKYQEYLLEKNDNNPRRLYVDLENCQITPDLQKNIPIDDGLLRRVRTGQYSQDSVRIVLDTLSLDDYKIFSLQEPFRIVIDVKGQKKSTITIAEKSTPEAPSLVQQLGLGIRRIVLDPGHGGKDSGAIGPGGMMEKDIVLNVAHKVAQKMRNELSCEVILTRDKDVFIPLEERTAIANTKEGDLFISIHANADPTKRARGVETYFLDLAKNKNAMQVAARENSSSASQLSDLQTILNDLIQNSKMQESVKLAEYIQENMVNGLSEKYSDINDLGVKQAPFIVLIGARMPSILSEIAFISNPKEAKRLRSDKFLDHVADQIVAGVSQYVTDLNLASLGPQY
ncbi:MAG: N-acetylmuramoyl-L-alanine amidase [Proteobacteria bacterium]|nr:N-acetylmuramoyl-L-alanine amidase [Pseudomonadota bacterium]MBU1716428.1 N-acetylmuramoyl-L-alanine amidase [Pseudomonadota bacterium]